MADGHHRIFWGEVVLPGMRHWLLLVFVLIWFPSVGEIQIKCDMSMDEAVIPMLVTMSK